MDTQQFLDMVHVIKEIIVLRASWFETHPTFKLLEELDMWCAFLEIVYRHVWHEATWRQDSGTLKATHKSDLL